MGGWRVEYAKSGRSKCKKCEDVILQNEVRMGREFEAPGGGGYEMCTWHHLRCLTQRQGMSVLEKHANGIDVPGMEGLAEADRVAVAAAIEAIANGTPAAEALAGAPAALVGAPASTPQAKSTTPAKKRKAEDDEDNGEAEEHEAPPARVAPQTHMAAQPHVTPPAQLTPQAQALMTPHAHMAHQPHMVPQSNMNPQLNPQLQMALQARLTAQAQQAQPNPGATMVPLSHMTPGGNLGAANLGAANRGAASNLVTTPGSGFVPQGPSATPATHMGAAGYLGQGMRVGPAANMIPNPSMPTNTYLPPPMLMLNQGGFPAGAWSNAQLAYAASLGMGGGYGTPAGGHMAPANRVVSGAGMGSVSKSRKETPVSSRPKRARKVKTYDDYVDTDVVVGPDEDEEEQPEEERERKPTPKAPRKARKSKADAEDEYDPHKDSDDEHDVHDDEISE